jgi:hypothetical protein
MLIPYSTCKKFSPSPGWSPRKGSSAYCLQLLLAWVGILHSKKHSKTFAQKDPRGPCLLIIFPPSTFLPKIWKGLCPKREKSEKAEPGSVFFTQPGAFKEHEMQLTPM